MSEESSDKKRPAPVRLASWVYGIVSEAGWARKTLLAAAIVALALIAALVCGGADYRDDPSALAPRSAYLYVETRDLELFLKNVGTWKLWDAEHRSGQNEQWNALQRGMASAFGARIPGVGARLILDAKRAAIVVSSDREASGDRDWALFIDVQDPSAVLTQIRVEPGIAIREIKGEKGELVELTTANGKLHLAAVQPWLVISSGDKLPKFAFESVRKPSVTLAHSGLLADWTRSLTLRGVVNPSYFAERSDLSGLFFGADGWTDANARLSYTAKFDASGLADTRVQVKEFDDRVTGGGIWPLIKFILYILGLLCVVVILVTLFFIIGWSGWLKTLAVRAGIAPAAAPKQVELSKAFTEDAGGEPAAAETAEAAAADEAADTEAPPAESGDAMPEENAAAPEGDTEHTNE